MTAPHFFLEGGGLEAGSSVVLSAEDSRHALRSLRLRAGEAVTLADGDGAVAAGVLAGDREGRAEVEVREVRRVDRPRPSLSVVLAPPKGDRLSWAVQKLAELGVDEVLLLASRRTVREWDEARAARAVARLAAVAREAGMQARSPFSTRVRGPVDLAAAVPDTRAAPDLGTVSSGGRRSSAGAGAAPVVVLWELASVPLADILPVETPAALSIVVGPEGGFEEEEVRAAEERGAAAASLGQRILRTETAAVVGAALALARYGRLG